MPTRKSVRERRRGKEGAAYVGNWRKERARPLREGRLCEEKRPQERKTSRRQDRKKDDYLRGENGPSQD